jgi:hypothetical protein
VITGGVLDVPGRTLFEKKVYLARRHLVKKPKGRQDRIGLPPWFEYSLPF